MAIWLKCQLPIHQSQELVPTFESTRGSSHWESVCQTQCPSPSLPATPSPRSPTDLVFHSQIIDQNNKGLQHMKLFENWPMPPFSADSTTSMYSSMESIGSKKLWTALPITIRLSTLINISPHQPSSSPPFSTRSVRLGSPGNTWTSYPTCHTWCPCGVENLPEIMLYEEKFCRLFDSGVEFLGTSWL